MCCHLEGCTLLSWCKLKVRQRNTNKDARTKTSRIADHERELLFIDFFSAFFPNIIYASGSLHMLVGVCFYRSTVLESGFMLGSKLLVLVLLYAHLQVAVVTTARLLATLVKVAYNNDPKELLLERTNSGALQDISCGHPDGARYFYPALDIFQEKHQPLQAAKHKTLTFIFSTTLSPKCKQNQTNYPSGDVI